MATYLFDFDGTLVDSMPTFVGAFFRIMERYHMPHDGKTVKDITPLGYRGSAKYLIDRGMPLTEEEILREVNDFAQAAYHNTIVAKKHVKETLEALRAKGDRLYVLTASPHSVLDSCLARNELLSLFEEVWSCEDFATTKADPAIYRMAADRIGLPVGEVIFLDDNIGACQTAKSAGMRVYAVYDETSEDMKDEMRALCDRYITDFSELLEV